MGRSTGIRGWRRLSSTDSFFYTAEPGRGEMVGVTLSFLRGRCQGEAELSPRKASSGASGWRRHLEGWEILVSIGSIAVGAAALAIPRAAIPRELPLPRVDRAEEARLARAENERLLRAERHPLPYLVRGAGDAFRRIGSAEASAADRKTLEDFGREFTEDVAGARKRYGDAALLDLRAVQTALFVRAVAGASSTPPASRDANELGGAFMTLAPKRGWTDANGRLVLDDDEVACVFRVRWSRLAGLLEVFPFTPSLNEWRLYYRTHMVHAPRDAGVVGTYVAGLLKHDPEYPALLALGIVAYWDGRFGDSTELLARHLREHSTGPWRLRAQNYLLSAYARAPAE